MKRFGFVSILVNAWFLVAGCGGSEPPGVPSEVGTPGGDPALVGTWRLMTPGESTPKMELVFGADGKVVVRKGTYSAGGAPSLVDTFAGTYSVSDGKVTFSGSEGQARRSRRTNIVIAGNELAIVAGDDDDKVFVPKGTSAAAPLGSWVFELSTSKYAANGTIERSATVKVEVDVQPTGTMSFSAIEEKVRDSTPLPASRVVGHGTWREISPGRYLVKPNGTQFTELMTVRLLGGALVTEGAIFVRQQP